MLGVYRTAGRIGRGGMGVVYAAYGPGSERVAVKVISPELSDDESFRERFRREVESARRVRQFCTAPVLDAQLDGEPLYIVTEYIDGPDLNEFLQTQGPMRGSSLEHLSVGVATALAAIHGAGIVHRDLKPANVLLSPFGPRVIDFGIARALDGAAHVTRTGQFIGTPSYMAPELIGGGQGTPASDVFAWGCLVVHAATGRPPFGGPTVPAVLHQILQGVPDLGGLDDPGLRAVVERALERDPVKRPTAQELLNLLVGQENVDTAQIADTVDRGWTEVREARSASTAVAPPTTFTDPPNGLPNGPGRSERPPGRFTFAGRDRWILGGAAALVVLLVAVLVVVFGGDDGPPSAILVSKDDFNNSDSGWIKDDYKNGGLEFGADGTSPRTVYSKSPYNGTIPDRMLTSVDVTMHGQGSDYFAIICSETENNNTAYGYAFTVRFDGGVNVAAWTKDPKIGNRLLYARESAPGFRQASSNHVQVACEKQGSGTRLRLWLNGTPAADTQTETPVDQGPPALIGTLGGDKDAQATVDFKHFQLSKITG